MREHQIVTVGLHGFAAAFEQLLQQGRRELPARKAQVAEQLGVDQAADAIVVEHQPVFLLDLGAGHGLGIGKAVADQLEHHRIAGQGEHRHHHAALAVGVDEGLVSVPLQMREEMPVALGLALLGATQHGVELVDRFVRQQGAQEHHRIAHGFQIGVKVAAGVAEQHRNLGALGDQRDHDRREAALAVDAADQIGAALAVEHRLHKLQAAHGRRLPVGQLLLDTLRQLARAVLRIGIGHGERIVVEHARERRGEIARHRIAATRDRMGDAIRGRDRQRHELDRRIHAAGREEAARERVEEGLVQLLVEQAGDQLGVARMDARPQRLVLRLRFKLGGQPCAGGSHAAVVELDALDRVRARAQPVALLEAPPRALGDRAEVAVVALKGIADGSRRQLDAGLVGRALRECVGTGLGHVGSQEDEDSRARRHPRRPGCVWSALAREPQQECPALAAVARKQAAQSEIRRARVPSGTQSPHIRSAPIFKASGPRQGHLKPYIRSGMSGTP